MDVEDIGVPFSRAPEEIRVVIESGQALYLIHILHILYNMCFHCLLHPYHLMETSLSDKLTVIFSSSDHYFMHYIVHLIVGDWVELRRSYFNSSFDRPTVLRCKQHRVLLMHKFMYTYVCIFLTKNVSCFLFFFPFIHLMYAL